MKDYGTLRALNGISINIQAGEWVALMGPSGSGKTTLINILGGLDTLTSGHVVVDGVDLANLSENDLVRYRAEKVGFVFQQFHLVPYLNALENVMLAQYFHSVTDEAASRGSIEARGTWTPADAFAFATFGRGAATSGDCAGADQPAEDDSWPMSRQETWTKRMKRL